MTDKKERAYSEEDLCEYTILQKIDELEKQLKNIKNEFNGMYETKEAADSIHRLLRSNDAKINNRIDGLYNITPTDVGVKDNKLGLLHDTAWLTNQNAINLGSNITYDEATKTLNSSGGKVPAGTKNDPFKLSTLNFYYDRDNNYVTFYDNTANYQTYTRINTGSSGVNISALNIVDDNKAFISFSASMAQSSSNLKFQVAGVNNKSLYFYVDNSNENIQSYIPALARPSIDGTYNLQITKAGNSYHYDWIKVG